jgi:uncharacterized protein YbjT (DUF2867 family)
MILVTGATGNVGAELLKRLVERGQPVRAFVRDPKRAARRLAPGVELFAGDFRDASTFLPALGGVDRLFLLIPSSPNVERQQKDFVDAAKQGKVRQIVKLSQLGANEHARGRFPRYHGAVENYILKSGIRYTFLRPNLFMQGLLNFATTISSDGALFAPIGNARVSVVDVRDIAAVAASVLTEAGHEGKAYDLTGPESLTHAEMATKLSRALGKPIAHIDIPPVAMKEALLSLGMPQWQAEGVVEDYDQYRDGEAARTTSTVEDITRAAPHSFAQFAKDYAAAFLGLIRTVGRDSRS